MLKKTVSFKMLYQIFIRMLLFKALYVELTLTDLSFRFPGPVFRFLFAFKVIIGLNE
jgi:hypothetical protein